MSSEWATKDWATKEREMLERDVLINTGNPKFTSQFQEYAISLLTKVMQGSVLQNVTEDIAHQILISQRSPEDEWYTFCNLIFGAAMSTSENSVHKRLGELVFALANHKATDTENPSEKEEKIAKFFSTLHGFGWIARDLWNGPKIFPPPMYETPEAAVRAWVNLNRFVAHLSVQQRLTPVEPFQDGDWLEDYGLWTISLGLEFRRHPDYMEAAWVWLEIAGHDIKNDLKWGRRDGERVDGLALRVGPLWTQRWEEGATVEMRWDFWIERIGEISRDVKVDALIRERAGEVERVVSEI